jgi:hypothetical protein
MPKQRLGCFGTRSALFLLAMRRDAGMLPSKSRLSTTPNHRDGTRALSSSPSSPRSVALASGSRRECSSPRRRFRERAAAKVRLLGQTRMVPLNSTAFVAVTGNGLTVTEDLARRFILCELDARCEDPEVRPFRADFLDQIERRRAELLTAVLAACPDRALLQGDEDREQRRNSPRHQAKDRSFESLIVEWLNQHPAPSALGRCLWCGTPESPSAVVLPFGTEPGTHAWLHAECWPAWQLARRADAIAALAATGVGPGRP